jgi:putative serine protease PepD
MRVVIRQGGRIVGEKTVDRDAIRIGRLSTSDVVLEGEGIARFHAVVEVALDGPGFSVVDMGSPGGTRLRGERICRAPVDEGEPIEIGPYRLTIYRSPKLEVVEEVPLEAILDEVPEPKAPPTGEMVIVPVEGDLVAAPVAKVLWAATQEEMDQALPTGEVPIPLTLRRR